MIREGEPCHLHLDLEYATATNPSHDGERMVARLRQELVDALVANYDVAAEDVDVVDLESSTPAKFSRHVLLRLRGAAFADNTHCGRFIAACVEALHVRSADDAELGELFVCPPPLPTEPATPAPSAPAEPATPAPPVQQCPGDDACGVAALATPATLPLSATAATAAAAAAAAAVAAAASPASAGPSSEEQQRSEPSPDPTPPSPLGWGRCPCQTSWPSGSVT